MLARTLSTLSILSHYLGRVLIAVTALYFVLLALMVAGQAGRSLFQLIANLVFRCFNFLIRSGRSNARYWKERATVTDFVMGAAAILVTVGLVLRIRSARQVSWEATAAELVEIEELSLEAVPTEVEAEPDYESL
ncbi:MAG: hypothetical protein BroJett011_42830 [Chloroflexota bacterium]|nr:MAG: hypothetical protein BroJett011_42830 [Chloroflexota bacterium]